MSKYIKLDTAIEHTNQLYHGDEVEAWLESLPTIEVSEDAISREWLIYYFSKGAGLLADNTETIIHGIKSAPSVIPQVPNEDTIKREVEE